MSKGERIPNKIYRQREGISASDLKKIMRSPAHYKYYKDNPQEDTPSLLFGRCYHKMCLETSEFDTEFAVAPICDRRTKEGKQIWNDFVAESEGKDIITAEMYEQVHEMRKVLMSTKFVPKLINGTHEMSFFWADEDTGVKCKCRPDSYGMLGNTGILVDLKTTSDASTDGFMRQANKLFYDLQMAYYLDGLKACTGKDYEVLFIAQEKSDGYAVNILQADNYFIEAGRELYKQALQTYKECCESGNFYGYMGADCEINGLSVPKWLKDSMGDLEESEEN